VGLAEIDGMEYGYFIGMLLKGFCCTWDICNSSYCMRVSAIPTLYILAESADSIYAWTSIEVTKQQHPLSLTKGWIQIALVSLAPWRIIYPDIDDASLLSLQLRRDGYPSSCRWSGPSGRKCISGSRFALHSDYFHFKL